MEGAWSNRARVHHSRPARDTPVAICQTDWPSLPTLSAKLTMRDRDWLVCPSRSMPKAQQLETPRQWTHRPVPIAQCITLASTLDVHAILARKSGSPAYSQSNFPNRIDSRLAWLEYLRAQRHGAIPRRFFLASFEFEASCPAREHPPVPKQLSLALGDRRRRGPLPLSRRQP